ncbi:hypothetical protein BJ546DRAFT_1063755 [Cryomyces antarcticus]
MKTLSAFLAFLPVVLAASPLLLFPFSTKQPNGSPEGQTNYYNTIFNIAASSIASNGTNVTDLAYCWASWADNCGLCTPSYAYSTYVPTGWIQCDKSSSQANFGKKEGAFAFRLHPYFSIGNVTIDVAHNVTDASGTRMTYGSVVITNTTAQYTCQISGYEDHFQSIHASGTCSIPDGQTSISIPTSNSTS